jgi:hypothetical protein
MSSARFYLKLTPEQLLEYYQGHKKYVRVDTFQGFSIRFRAEHLRRWVTKSGIDGVFEIRFDEHRNFKELVMVMGPPGGGGGGGGQGGGPRGGSGRGFSASA